MSLCAGQIETATRSQLLYFEPAALLVTGGVAMNTRFNMRLAEELFGARLLPSEISHDSHSDVLNSS